MSNQIHTDDSNAILWLQQLEQMNWDQEKLTQQLTDSRTITTVRDQTICNPVNWHQTPGNAHVIHDRNHTPSDLESMPAKRPPPPLSVVQHPVKLRRRELTLQTRQLLPQFAPLSSNSCCSNDDDDHDDEKFINSLVDQHIDDVPPLPQPPPQLSSDTPSLCYHDNNENDANVLFDDDVPPSPVPPLVPRCWLQMKDCKTKTMRNKVERRHDLTNAASMRRIRPAEDERQYFVEVQCGRRLHMQCDECGKNVAFQPTTSMRPGFSPDTLHYHRWSCCKKIFRLCWCGSLFRAVNALYTCPQCPSATSSSRVAFPEGFGSLSMFAPQFRKST